MALSNMMILPHTIGDVAADADGRPGMSVPLTTTLSSAGTGTTEGPTSPFDLPSRVDGLAQIASRIVTPSSPTRALRNQTLTTAGGGDIQREIEQGRQRGRQIGETTAGTFGRDRFALTGIEGDGGPAATRRLGLSRVIAEADAANRVRLGANERQRIGLEGAAGLATQADAMVLGGMRDAAAGETQRRISAEARSAQRSAARRETIGQVIGAGISLAAMSARELKENFAPVDTVLDRLDRVPVERWNYMQHPDTDLIGPMAGDFNREFGVQTPDPGKIELITMLGVLFAAVQELSAEVKALKEAKE